MCQSRTRIFLKTTEIRAALGNTTARVQKIATKRYPIAKTSGASLTSQLLSEPVGGRRSFREYSALSGAGIL
jgi:hypothetical protein